MPQAVPEHLKRADDESDLMPAGQTIPRVIVCTANSKQVESGDAKPGDVITDELVRVTEPVSICGTVHYWAMYPEFTSGGNNQPIWTALYGSKESDRPECKWDGKKKPAAAEVIKLALYSPQLGLRVLVCQRSAVKNAKQVLREIDELGVRIYGPLWKLGSEKQGKTFVPTFEHVGFADEQLSANMARPQTIEEVSKLLSL